MILNMTIIEMFAQMCLRKEAQQTHVFAFNSVHNYIKVLCIWKWMSLYMQPQKQGWKATASFPLRPPTQRPSHQVGGWQSTLIGQLMPPVR